MDRTKSRILTSTAQNNSAASSDAQKHLGTIQASNAQAQLLVPTGVVLPFAGPATPQGYLLCDGSEVDYENYRTLFNVIGYSYTSGTPTGTKFNLPDLRGRVPVGVDYDGDPAKAPTYSASGRLTANNQLAQASGADKHTLITGEMPSHAHTTYAVQATNTTATGSGNRLTFLGGPSTPTPDTGSTSSVGSGNAHNNMQPYLVLNYIIKY
jgi:microcystin-dependent protein